MNVFCFKFLWSLFLIIQLTIRQHLFRTHTWGGHYEGGGGGGGLDKMADNLLATFLKAILVFWYNCQCGMAWCRAGVARTSHDSLHWRVKAFLGMHEFTQYWFIINKTSQNNGRMDFSWNLGTDIKAWWNMYVRAPMNWVKSLLLDDDSGIILCMRPLNVVYAPTNVVLFICRTDTK